MALPVAKKKSTLETMETIITRIKNVEKESPNHPEFIISDYKEDRLNSTTVKNYVDLYNLIRSEVLLNPGKIIIREEKTRRYISRQVDK